MLSAAALDATSPAPRRIRLLGGEVDLVTAEEVMDFIAARVLDHLGIEHSVGRRWKSGEKQGTGDWGQGTGEGGNGRHRCMPRRAPSPRPPPPLDAGEGVNCFFIARSPT